MKTIDGKGEIIKEEWTDSAGISRITVRVNHPTIGTYQYAEDCSHDGDKLANALFREIEKRRARRRRSQNR